MAKLRKVLHVPDVHSPFHDKLAWRLFLKIAKKINPDECVIHGDFFDFYSVSRHDKDPLMDFKTWKDEMKEARRTLDELMNAIKPKKWVFLEGNHCARLVNYLNNHAPKLAGIFRPEEMLGIPEEMKFIPYGQEGIYKIGKLICVHGSRAGENPAASMVKKFRSNVIFGHTHKIQEYHIQNAHGDDFVGLNIGWLGDQRRCAKYIKDISDWSLGFGITYHKLNGDFYYQLVHIKKTKGVYHAMFDGEVVEIP